MYKGPLPPVLEPNPRSRIGFLLNLIQMGADLIGHAERFNSALHYNNSLRGPVQQSFLQHNNSTKFVVPDNSHIAAIGSKSMGVDILPEETMFGDMTTSYDDSFRSYVDDAVTVVGSAALGAAVGGPVGAVALGAAGMAQVVDGAKTRKGGMSYDINEISAMNIRKRRGLFGVASIEDFDRLEDLTAEEVTKTMNGNTALHINIMNENYEVALKMAQLYPALANIPDAKGRYPIQMALALDAGPELLNDLLTRKSLTAVDKDGISTAMYAAAFAPSEFFRKITTLLSPEVINEAVAWASELTADELCDIGSKFAIDFDRSVGTSFNALFTATEAGALLDTYPPLGTDSAPDIGQYNKMSKEEKKELQSAIILTPTITYSEGKRYVGILANKENLEIMMRMARGEKDVRQQKKMLDKVITNPQAFWPAVEKRGQAIIDAGGLDKKTLVELYMERARKNVLIASGQEASYEIFARSAQNVVDTRSRGGRSEL